MASTCPVPTGQAADVSIFRFLPHGSPRRRGSVQASTAYKHRSGQILAFAGMTSECVLLTVVLLWVPARRDAPHRLAGMTRAGWSPSRTKERSILHARQRFRAGGRLPGGESPCAGNKARSGRVPRLGRVLTGSNVAQITRDLLRAIVQPPINSPVPRSRSAICRPQSLSASFL
jgi:hypothetical protein